MDRVTFKKWFERFNPDKKTTTILLNGYTQICEKEEYTDKRYYFLVGEAVDKLAKYEDAEEQGLLLRLPCKVGDTLYRIDTDERIENTAIVPYTIDNIVICNDEDILFKYDVYDGVICHLENIITDKPYLDYYRVFLTKEEAEAKLAELRG